MQSYLKHFYQITKIPHCSLYTKKLKEYIVKSTKEYGYDVEIDKSGNILTTSSDAAITLQAHYDMVCVGEYENIEVMHQNDLLSAKNSSLGADNGIGCAMMLALMQEGYKVDCLFTNDEEVGLIGANNLDLKVKTNKMINLDSEEYGKIYLGCAGGVDLNFAKKDEYISSRYENTYEVVANSDGGHSGVDINKGINNSIIEIAKFLIREDIELVSFEGGDRINAIPSFSKAIVKADNLKSNSNIRVIKTHTQTSRVLKNSQELIELIASFKNGVLSKDNSLNTVIDSCNFAIIDNNSFSISLRSMKKENLEKISSKIIKHFKGYRYNKEGKYEPWEPKITQFAKEVRNKYENSEFAAIHAGLECAVINKKYPFLEIVSIGPDIFFPHSVKEKCNINSCDKIFKLIKTLL